MAVKAVNGTQQVVQVTDSASVQQANQTELTFNYEATEADQNMGLVVEGKIQDAEDKASEVNIITDFKERAKIYKQYYSELFSKGIKEAKINAAKATLERAEKCIEQNFMPNLNRFNRFFATKNLELFDSKEQ